MTDRAIEDSGKLSARNRGVCILTESYFPQVGGGENQARTLAEDLAEAGWRVCIVTRRLDQSLKRMEPTDAYQVYRVPPSGPGHLKKWGMTLTCLPVLIRLRSEFDLIFVSGFRVLGIPAVIASLILRKKCVLKADSQGEMSGEFFRRGLSRFALTPAFLPVKLVIGLRNRLFRSAHGFVAVSSAIEEELISNGVQKERIYRIPNSVDERRYARVDPSQKLELRRRLGLPNDCFILTFSGRLVRYKGLPLLLRAWKELASANGHSILVLLGSGGQDVDNCEDELRSFVKENDLSGSVRFFGVVTNVDEYLKASDAFVFPTENEAFGLSLVEAMACGLPVVSTKVGGTRDIIEDGRSGLVVLPGRKSLLKQAIQALMDSPQLRERLGDTAAESVKMKFSRKSVASQFFQLFEQL